MLRPGIWLVLLAVSTACRSPTSPGAHLVIQTDSASFYLGGGGAAVTFTITNAAEEAATLATCDGILFPTFEAMTPTGIVPREIGGCDPPWRPVLIAPGEVYRGQTRIGGVGRWRFRVPLLTPKGHARLSTTASNEFLIY